MATTSRKIRSWTAQTSFAAAALFTLPALAQTAPAKPSAACQKAQQNVAKEGMGKYTISDLTAHPTLAGQSVSISISVKDALGQAARSEKCVIAIPQQEFRHPVSQVMVELRRTLARDSRNAGDVTRRFGKLLDDRAATIQNPETLAALKAVHKTLSGAQDAATLDTTIHSMWQLMQQLEKENMSAVEKRLREMEQALREALQRGVPEKELHELTKESMQAMQDAMKEQAAKSGKDEQAKRDLESMEKQLEEMQKKLEELQQTDPKMAQQMQKLMKQMQEMMAQQQKQQSQEQQGQEQDQQQQGQPQQGQPQQGQPQKQKSPEQMRQEMQRRMQQMQQRMQQQQQDQTMKNEMNDLIKKQEELRNETAEEREKRKEDMDEILKKLEEAAAALKSKINERRSEEYKRRHQLTPNTYPGSYGSGVAPKFVPDTVILAYSGKEPLLLADAAPQPRRGADDAQRNLNRLVDLDKEVSEIVRDLRNKRISKEQLRESEAETIMKRFQEIYQELKQQEDEMQENRESEPEKDEKKQEDQKKQHQNQKDQQKKNKDLLDRIEQMMEQMRQKNQDKQQQQGQKSQKQGNQKQQQMSEQQRQLEKQLEKLTQEMRERGMEPRRLDDAKKPMDDSADELDQGDPGDAVPRQEDALTSLREGKQQMEDQMKQRMQQQQGQPMPGDNPGDNEGEGDKKRNPDALGRVAKDPEATGEARDANLGAQRREELNRLLQNQNLLPQTREYYERLLRGKGDKPAPPQLK